MAWTNDTAGDNQVYVSGTEDLTLPDSDGASETSVNSSDLDVDVSDSKFTVFLEVTETAAGDGALEVRLQASPDGTNFYTVDTTSSMALDTTGTNSAIEDLDATDFYAPHWRFQVFSDGTDTQDSAGLTIKYAAKQTY